MGTTKEVFAVILGKVAYKAGYGNGRSENRIFAGYM